MSSILIKCLLCYILCIKWPFYSLKYISIILNNFTEECFVKSTYYFINNSENILKAKNWENKPIKWLNPLYGQLIWPIYTKTVLT